MPCLVVLDVARQQVSDALRPSDPPVLLRDTGRIIRVWRGYRGNLGSGREASVLPTSETMARAMAETRRSWNGMRQFIPGMPPFDEVMGAKKDV